MQSLEPTQPFKQLIHSGVTDNVINLDHINPFRRAYYKDMSSNLVIEKALRAVSDFSYLDLTKVTKEQAKGYNQYLAAFDSVRFASDLE